VSQAEDGFRGFAVVSDTAGRIRKVLRNDLADRIDLSQEGMLTAVVEENSLQKFFTFLYRLRKEKALYDWSINVHGAEEVFELYFVGGMNDQEMIIVASTSGKVAESYLDEVMRMNNEQANLLRSTMKQEAAGRENDEGENPGGEHAGGESSDGDEHELYDDFTRLNNELANLQRDLQKQNRVLQQTIKERDKYLGMAAHDLRNPLGGISGIAKLFLEGEYGELTREQREYIKMMKDSAEHMLEIVAGMLELSKHQIGTLQLNWEDADLITLVDRSIALNQPNARKKQIEIHKEAELASLPLRIDRVKITQVLDNLLSNAVKYSHPETVVTLKVETEEHWVRVKVSDQGQGIPEDELPKLFQPFTKLSVKATGGEKSIGLGLAVCRKIVEGHGGTIEAQSSVGEGSNFEFSLPLAMQ